MGSFALDLQAFADKAGALADAVIRETMVHITTVIDDRSPVGDATYWKSKPPKGYVGGHFRANWQLGVGEIPGGVVPGHDYGVTLSANTGKLPQDAAGKMFYLANNVPYAQRIEDGWSHQHPAPQAVVGRTVTEFQDIVKAAVAKVAT